MPERETQAVCYTEWEFAARIAYSAYYVTWTSNHAGDELNLPSYENYEITECERSW